MTKLLIVDEDTDVLRLLRVKLTGAGYMLNLARDGQEAVTLATNEQPEVIIMEYLLPDMTGLELISKLFAVVHAAPLIIVLSNKTSDADIDSALSAGAVDYVTKPFSPQGLIERIRVNLIRAGLEETIAPGEQ